MSSVLCERRLPTKRAVRSGQPEKAFDGTTLSDPMALPNTDWLRHELAIVGTAEDVARFTMAAAGSGSIPWFYPNLDFEEDDRFPALVNPPDGSRGLSPAAARVLARELREATFQHQAKVRLQNGVCKTCPVDLHALIPVPAEILERGPDDVKSIAWLRANWGTLQALRQVRIVSLRAATKRQKRAQLGLEFWSADWTPWAAITALRRNWPSLVFPSSPITTMDENVGNLNWDDAERISGLPAIPTLHLDGFDGPMDLLLELAERQRIDLGKMSILALAEQFAAAMLELVGKVPIERRADWLVLATRLVVLRTRLLFPESPEAAADAVREAEKELGRLNELARMRAAASWLQARPQLGIDVFTRTPEDPARESGYVSLMEACLVLLRGRPGSETFEAPEILTVSVPDLWRIPEAIERIRTLLPYLPEAAPLQAFLPAVPVDDPNRALKARAAIASTFAAGLELAKEQFLSLQQNQDFGPIEYRGVGQRSERASEAA
jgi:segregation and condensation protein A